MAKMRLDKMLGNMGIGTRKEVKILVRGGRVTVNGERAWTGADHVDPDNDDVVVDGVSIGFKKNIYLMLNKPQGVVSATEDSRDETVIELVPEEYLHYDLFPVGRLDKDTEGLLLITNDGKLAHKLLSPKKHVDKKYFATIDKTPNKSDTEAFAKGVMLDDGYVTLPAKLEVIEGSDVYVTIQEGKFHQIKRMFIARGKEVTYLKRLEMGSLKLDESLELGEIRELTDEELKALYE